MSRGFFGIGVYHPKTSENIGTLWRHAYIYGASFMFVIGRRYSHQVSDTLHAVKHVPLYHYESFADFSDNRPYDCPLVCIELEEDAVPLPEYFHPERVVYLLGAEDHGLPQGILEMAQTTVSIPVKLPFSLNVATAGTLVMYDRYVKSK